MTIPPCPGCGGVKRELVTTKTVASEGTNAEHTIPTEPLWHCPDCEANEVPFPPAE